MTSYPLPFARIFENLIQNLRSEAKFVLISPISSSHHITNEVSTLTPQSERSRVHPFRRTQTSHITSHLGSLMGSCECGCSSALALPPLSALSPPSLSPSLCSQPTLRWLYLMPRRRATLTVAQHSALPWWTRHRVPSRATKRSVK